MVPEMARVAVQIISCKDEELWLGLGLRLSAAIILFTGQEGFGRGGGFLREGGKRNRLGSGCYIYACVV